jgi:hypothetical protein
MPHTIALVKIRVTMDGLGCEITAKSNEAAGEASFARVVIGNVLELIALPMMQ